MLAEFRKAYPQYDDMPDDVLMKAIHAKFYPDMDEGEFMGKMTPRPNHDDLETAAVRGEDSLDLQDMDPSVKPVVKMTMRELVDIMQRRQLLGKSAYITGEGVVYIIDPAAIEPHEAVAAITSGDDSAILGYPAKGDRDAAVTRQGDVVTDLAEMKGHADAGNLLWAANGAEGELMDKAAQVSRAVRG